jgi:two-component system cell cycle sensor histidine kinase/response regulator CckA
MPDGGTIDVDVSRVAIGLGMSPYPGLQPGAYVRVAVADTGTGIDPEMQPHIFEPFFTSKGPSKGTGLGLSIVYGVARDAGGTVTFSTVANKGTTFEVVLPAVAGG